jgi:hypothetical protein
MKELESQLRKAVRRVAEAKAIIERQRERLANLEAHGLPTLDAEQTLDIFIGTLRCLEDHARLIKEWFEDTGNHGAIRP